MIAYPWIYINITFIKSFIIAGYGCNDIFHLDNNIMLHAALRYYTVSRTVNNNTIPRLIIFIIIITIVTTLVRNDKKINRARTCLWSENFLKIKYEFIPTLPLPRALVIFIKHDVFATQWLMMWTLVKNKRINNIKKNRFANLILCWRQVNTCSVFIRHTIKSAREKEHWS